VSPEQARGKSTDYRSDLWSLGVIAFECITGRPPFQAEALGELMGQILYEDPPKPTERAPGLLPSVDTWWERAAQRDREQRFQSAKELSDALGRALGVTRMVVVPSIPPRQSLPAPADGERNSAPPSPPVLPVELRETALPNSDSAPPPEPAPAAAVTTLSPASDSTRDSDAPLSRTRHSLAVRFPNLRRRHLFAFAGGGVLLGVLLTLMLIGGDESEPSAADAQPMKPAVAARPVETVRIETVEKAAPLPASTQPPVPAANVHSMLPGTEPEIVVEAESEPDPKSEPREPRSGRASKETTRKRPPPAPVKRTKPASPDYGI
jgi:serine/threonine-protein kinase